jgi:hypothetical protein
MRLHEARQDHPAIYFALVTTRKQYRYSPEKM